LLQSRSWSLFVSGSHATHWTNIIIAPGTVIRQVASGLHASFFVCRTTQMASQLITVATGTYKKDHLLNPTWPQL
jgi:hypothetical protein